MVMVMEKEGVKCERFQRLSGDWIGTVREGKVSEVPYKSQIDQCAQTLGCRTLSYAQNENLGDT